MTAQFVFQDATKRQAKLRLGIDGPSGSGKTMTALRIARGVVGPQGRIGLIDTEAGSASIYSNVTPFQTLVLGDFSVRAYIAAFDAAEKAGFDIIVVDSASHAWQELLADVDRRKAGQGNQFTAWSEPSKQYRLLVERILHSTAHVIVTLRSKMEYAQEGGQVKRLGLAPVQRDDFIYELTIVLSMDHKHTGTVTKTRYAAIADRAIALPGEALGEELAQWLNDGDTTPEPERAALTPPPAPTQTAPTRPAPTPRTLGPDALTAEQMIEFKDWRDRLGKEKGDGVAKTWWATHGFAGWEDFEARGGPQAGALIAVFKRNVEREAAAAQ